MLAGSILALLIAAAAATPWLDRWAPRFWGWATGVIPLGVMVILLIHGPEQSVQSWPWAPDLGLDWATSMDGLGWFFAVLITGIGAAIMPYAAGYLADKEERPSCRAWLLVFMAAMLGVVLSDNLILLYVSWELTGIASFMMIGIKRDEESRAAAQQALLITAAGGLALLAGLVLLAQAADSWSLAVITERASQVAADPLVVPILILVVIGAASKSALVPFQSWLPQAMAAPTPVSAYLHSATMVKAGIYLFARLQPTLSAEPLWTWLVGGIGAASLVVGGIHVLAAVDLKKMLAWSTIAALGLMALLLGIATPATTTAALSFVAAHALYKATMFMVAGSVDHATGSRDASRLRGLGKDLPWTWGAAILGGLSLAGVPPLFGFLAKEQALAKGLHDGGWMVAALVVFAGACFAFAALVCAWEIFVGRPAGGEEEHPHESAPPMIVGMVLLATAGLVCGLWSQPIQQPITAAAQSLHPGAEIPKLKLWPGLHPPLFLSLLAIVAGAGLYLIRSPLRRLAWLRLAPGPVYRRAVALIKATAWHLTRTLQNGNLRWYLACILATTIALVTTGLVAGGWPASDGHLSALADVDLTDCAILVVVVAGTLFALATRAAFSGVVALGAIGIGIALVFSAYSAPDLALAQILTDVLTVILFVLVFRNLPATTSPLPAAQRLFTAAIAILSGAAITLLLLSDAAQDAPTRVAQWYQEHAVPEGHGHNIVNVILVDFRALDTLGEITVLALAAIGVGMLLMRRLRPCPPPESDTPEPPAGGQS